MKLVSTFELEGMEATYLYNIRKIDEHVLISIPLDSTSNVQSNRSHTLDPTTLNEASNCQFEDIEARISERGRHPKGKSNLSDVLVPYKYVSMPT